MPRPQVKAHQWRVCHICGCTEYKRCRYLPRRGVPWTPRIGMRFCLSTTATAVSKHCGVYRDLSRLSPGARPASSCEFPDLCFIRLSSARELDIILGFRYIGIRV